MWALQVQAAGLMSYAAAGLMFVEDSLRSLVPTSQTSSIGRKVGRYWPRQAALYLQYCLMLAKLTDYMHMHLQHMPTQKTPLHSNPPLINNSFSC